MSISAEMARRILEASKRRAQEFRSPVSIAIVDAGGHLVLFERMMAPYGYATTQIAIAKACTSVMFNQSTDAVAQWGSGIPGFAASMTAMTEGKFIMAAGGWPIRINGATIGGIGVSGGNAPGRDDEIARAGLIVLDSDIGQHPPQQAFPLSAAQQPSYAPPLAQQQANGNNVVQQQAPQSVRPMSSGPNSMYLPAASVMEPEKSQPHQKSVDESYYDRVDTPKSGTNYLAPDQEATSSNDEAQKQIKPDHPGGQA